MIRLANENDFNRTISSESSLRIHALKSAYGLSVPFIQYYSDGEGTIASIMDGVCTLSTDTLLSDEWVLFLQMRPDIQKIHTEKHTADQLVKPYGTTYKNGMVMRLQKVSSSTTLHDSILLNPSLRDVYALQNTVFDEFSPFDGWYVDVSHRVRHGVCHIAAKTCEQKLVSVAMTVAETNDFALIGGVATLTDYRSKGFASECIQSLLGTLSQKTILISPKDERSANLYRYLGFVPWGTWAEISLL